MEEKRLQFKLPLIFLKTERFNPLFESLGRRKIVGHLSWLGIIIMVSVAILGTFLIINSIQSLITRPEVAEVQREAGPQSFILLPGFNPYLPIIYGWLAILVGIIVHEGAHGIVAKNLNYKIHSSGFLFFLFIPIGAFVEVDEKQLQESKAKNAVRVMAAGPGANVIVAVVSLSLLLTLLNGLYPAVDGLYVVEVLKDYPASKAGLMEKDIIYSVDGKRVLTPEDLSKALEDKKPGEVVILNVIRNEKEKFYLPVKISESIGGPKLGIRIVPLATGLILENYKSLVIQNPFALFIPPTFGLAQYFIPYSDALHSFYSHNFLGSFYYPIAQLLFWIWFININLAIFNSLPIFPLDGGQSFRSFLKNFLGSKLKDKGINYVTYTFTFFFITLIITMIILPYIINP
ncbi:hypothetical protein HRbin06_00441 [archaeon HR06]|nr:hypothetical protein HRbin06_00441 [archaeon HR06]